MAKRIFVTATNTDIGKTYTSRRLVQIYSQMGYRVGVYKPIETGVIDIAQDAQALYESACLVNPSFSALGVDDVAPLTFPLPAAPFVASGGITLDFSLFDAALERIEGYCDLVIIEGAGGLMVPIDGERMMIDLPGHFGAATLLLTHCRLGCINDTLLSMQALEAKNLPYRWALNCRVEDTGFEETSLPYFQHRFETLYRIDRDAEALAKALLDTIP